MGNTNTGSPFQFRDNQYVASVNLSWFKGAHMFRTGFDYQNQQMNHFQPQGGTFQTPRGTFGFNGQTTMLQNAPAPSDVRFNSWAAFLLGLPTSAGKVDQLRNPNSFRMKAYAAYVQDTWQVTHALTFTYGLRWEIYPFPTRGGGLGVSRFDPADGNVYNGGVGDVPVDTGASSGSGRLLPRAGVGLSPRRQDGGSRGLRPDPRPQALHRLPQRVSHREHLVPSHGHLQRGQQRLPAGDDAAAMDSIPRPTAPRRTSLRAS